MGHWVNTVNKIAEKYPSVYSLWFDFKKVDYKNLVLEYFTALAYPALAKTNLFPRYRPFTKWQLMDGIKVVLFVDSPFWNRRKYPKQNTTGYCLGLDLYISADIYKIHQNIFISLWLCLSNAIISEFRILILCAQSNKRILLYNPKPSQGLNMVVPEFYILESRLENRLCSHGTCQFLGFKHHITWKWKG